MIVETEAVVLHSIHYGDTSKIVTLYSRKYGKIKVVAKGARNPKTNKFGSSLEPMTHSSVVLYKKEHRDLHLLSKSEIVTSFSKTQDISEKMFTGLSLIELVNMVMHDEEENELIFVLLVDSLKAIDASTKNRINVLLSFLTKMFSQFGFGLSLEQCERCGKLSDKEDFSLIFLRLSDGKFICQHCSEGTTVSGVKVTGGALKSLIFLQTNDSERVLTLSLSHAMREDILGLLQSYLRYHVEGSRTLKSLSLLHTLQ